MSEHGVPILRPPAEFTAATPEAFEREAQPHCESGSSGLVIDLEPVTFISSAGLGRLVHLGHSMGSRGVSVALAGGSRSVVKLIRTVGLDVVMPHFPTVEAARTFLLGSGGDGK